MMLSDVDRSDVSGAAQKALLGATRDAIEHLEMAHEVPPDQRYDLYVVVERSLRSAAQLCHSIAQAIPRPPKFVVKPARPCQPAMPRDLGEDLRRARENAGLSEDEAAEALGITATVLADIETAQRLPNGRVVEAASSCPWLPEPLVARLEAASEYVSQTAPIGPDEVPSSSRSCRLGCRLVGAAGHRPQTTSRRARPEGAVFMVAELDLLGPSWHMGVLTVDGAGAWTLYYDGTSFASGTNSPAETGGTLAIGADLPGSSDRYFGGKIAQVAFFNTALSADEISQLYSLA